MRRKSFVAVSNKMKRALRDHVVKQFQMTRHARANWIAMAVFALAARTRIAAVTTGCDVIRFHLAVPSAFRRHALEQYEIQTGYNADSMTVPTRHI
jgi:hypothetical protein